MDQNHTTVAYWSTLRGQLLLTDCCFPSWDYIKAQNISVFTSAVYKFGRWVGNSQCHAARVGQLGTEQKLELVKPLSRAISVVCLKARWPLREMVPNVFETSLQDHVKETVEEYLCFSRFNPPVRFFSRHEDEPEENPSAINKAPLDSCTVPGSATCAS